MDNKVSKGQLKSKWSGQSWEAVTASPMAKRMARVVIGNSHSGRGQTSIGRGVSLTGGRQGVLVMEILVGPKILEV